MDKKYPVLVIEHVDTDELVYVWGKEDGLELLLSCLHRGERVEANLTSMTEKQYEALPDYEGEC
jgi:hypothetical protein